MTEPPTPSPEPAHTVESTSGGLQGLLERNRWLVFVLPFVVYMAMNSLEPTPPEPPPAALEEADEAAEEPAAVEPEAGGLLGIGYENYPAIYTLKIVLTLLAIALVSPGYREVPFRVTLLSLVVGVVGVVIWIVLAQLGLEHRLGERLGITWLADLGRRSAFNPLEQLADRPALAYGFLAVRFLGLVAVVPLIEEFFLRGFLMRFVMQADWWKVRFDAADMKGLIVVTVAAMAMHPGELLAAMVWFSLVSWLMLKTGSLWDCVTAHAVTNLLLGIYVVTTGHWQLM